ncbi:hypothetical protein L1987_71823 [Smallanthus sonchifolius]|uniref:Uncharacterized protein n=1 Tax=Smallanthus sonchifolius TaxID=185202 RepID=A0ACB9ASM4_9ASTR|nr:hypothetical protein L1987_71823 [Smallanthus sonchifolius]
MSVMDDKIPAKSHNQSSTQSNGAPPNKVPFIIGVAGGTASGKTTVCNVIISRLHDRRVVLINQNPSTQEWYSAKDCVVFQSSEDQTPVSRSPSLLVLIAQTGRCKYLIVLILQQLIYEKLPKDIASRQVLLLDPVLASGDSALEAISLLLNKGVSESNIIFLNLIAAPEGIHAVCRQYPRLKIVTSEIDEGLNEHSRVIPGMGDFGDRYFGTGGNASAPFLPNN